MLAGAGWKHRRAGRQGRHPPRRLRFGDDDRQGRGDDPHLIERASQLHRQYERAERSRGGNANFARIGRPLAIARAAQARVFIVGFRSILDRVSDPSTKPSLPEQGWPNDTYSGLRRTVVQRRGIQIFHQQATTDGDSIVMFRRADVIATGDIFDPTEYPDHRSEARAAACRECSKD
jgi:hypothetical protein